MLQLIFTKVVLGTKLLISTVFIFVSSFFTTSHNATPALPSPIAEATSTPKIELPKATVRPTNTPTYEELHCPKIIEVKDSLGNIENLSTRWSGINGAFKKGEVMQLRLTISAQDPQNKQLYYRFDSLGLEGTDQHSITSKDWSQDNFIDINVANSIAGTKRYISIYVDNRDGYSCYGSNDLYRTAFYNVTP